MSDDVYALYYENGAFARTGDMWTVLEAAITGSDEYNLLAEVRVGLVTDLTVADLLDADDIDDLIEGHDGLFVQHVVQLVSDQCGEVLREGRAFLLPSDAAAQAALDALRMGSTGAAFPALAIQWATENIELSHDRVAMGRYPLPIRLADGAWSFGENSDVHAAGDGDGIITYAAGLYAETGPARWRWSVGEVSGSALTLAEARDAVEKLAGKAGA